LWILDIKFAFMSWSPEKFRAHYISRHRHAVAYLGRACSSCGVTESLDFHHREPGDKVGNVTGMLRHSWESVLSEADKCILLCRPCHQQQHKSARYCGTAAMYWAGCRCVECRNAIGAYEKDRREKLGRPMKRADAHGEKNNASILTDADIRGIRTKIATGVSNAEIGRQYGVSSSTISLIKSRKTWSHVT
jgi:hypothetical protein